MRTAHSHPIVASLESACTGARVAPRVRTYRPEPPATHPPLDDVMPSEGPLRPLSDIASDIASPLRKRARTGGDAPPCVRALQGADPPTYVAFYVLSNSIGTRRAGDVPRLGPLGFYGDPQDCHRARTIQLAWACAAPGEAPRVTERFIAIPGIVEGDALGDVLLEFTDALLHAATPRLRVVTFDMEKNAGILLKEMERKKLHHAANLLERLVRTRGFDLMDPDVYAWLHGGSPTYPAGLQDLARAMPLGQRGFPELRTGSDEVASYLHFAKGLRELGMSDCQLTGHVPIRASRGCMRDNGEHSHDCGRCGAYLD
jgi:hypothetical protein